MNTTRTWMWAVGGIFGLALMAAITVPNLLRSRMAADQAALVARLRSAQLTEQDKNQAQLTLSARTAGPEKKLIHNAELGLVVADVQAAAERIRRLTEANHGEIDKVEITQTSGGLPSATLLVRVPASGLEDALAALKQVAVRTEREQINTRDVTREFYDNQAHLLNLGAEEQQYRAIMKQARTVKDTLEVAQKLSDVRDRIERLQTQIQLMAHDLEMSQVAIALMQEPDARVVSISWRPAYSAQVAARELAAGLGEWVDWVVAVLIKLPLVLVWVITLGGILSGAWKIGRTAWLRFLKPKPAGPAQ